MQSAAAATMPTTMPVVLLDSRITSTAPGGPRSPGPVGLAVGRRGKPGTEVTPGRRGGGRRGSKAVGIPGPKEKEREERREGVSEGRGAGGRHRERNNSLTPKSVQLALAETTRAGPARQPASACALSGLRLGCPGHPTRGLCDSEFWSFRFILRNQTEQKGKEIEKKRNFFSTGLRL